MGLNLSIHQLLVFHERLVFRFTQKGSHICEREKNPEERNRVEPCRVSPNS